MYFSTMCGSEAFRCLGLGIASLVDWPRNVSGLGQSRGVCGWRGILYERVGIRRGLRMALGLSMWRRLVALCILIAGCWGI